MKTIFNFTQLYPSIERPNGNVPRSRIDVMHLTFVCDNNRSARVAAIPGAPAIGVLGRRGARAETRGKKRFERSGRLVRRRVSGEGGHGRGGEIVNLCFVLAGVEQT